MECSMEFHAHKESQFVIKMEIETESSGSAQMVLFEIIERNLDSFLSTSSLLLLLLIFLNCHRPLPPILRMKLNGLIDLLIRF